MKKIISLVLALMLIFAFAPTAFAAAGYSDVPQDHWALENIKFANAQGIINGYWDGTFRPENPVTKEEAATMLYRALDAADALKSAEDFSAEYTDLFNQYFIADYARKYIAYFIKYDIINEAEIKDFSKGDAMGIAAPRVQTAVWTAKALDRDFVGAYYLPYTDTNQLLAGELPYIDLLYRNGIMRGSLQEDGTVKFLPKDGVKRCEFAAIANRVYEFKMSERSAGNSGYYDVSKEVVSYNNSLNSVILNKDADIIYNGKLVSSLGGLVGDDDIVRISSMTLSNVNDVQILVDSEEVAKSGMVSDVTALSATLTRVGIKTDSHIVYYLANDETIIDDDIFIFDLQNKDVEYIANGVYLVEIK